MLIIDAITTDALYELDEQRDQKYDTTVQAISCELTIWVAESQPTFEQMELLRAKSANNDQETGWRHRRKVSR